MIYSINNPKNFKAFKYIELTDYTKSINYSFLMGLNFEEDLMDSDDYGSIGTIQDICFLGTCIINDRKKTTYNCTLSCLKEIDKCFDGDNLCESKECDTYIWKRENSECHEFNRIKIWKNSKVKKTEINFEVNSYSHIIPHDGECKSGFHRCGIINNDRDYLCLNKTYDCPINNIIIKSENVSPDNYYKSYKFGDGYIFFTNQTTNNSLIMNFSFTLDNDKKINEYENYEIID